MSKPHQNTLVLYYANGARRVVSFVAKTGIPQIVFEGLKDVGIIAVFLISAEAGIDTSGELKPFFNLIAKQRTTRLGIVLSAAMFGTMLEVTHQIFRLMPNRAKNSAFIWLDHKTRQYQIAVYEGLYSASLTFTFVNGVLQKALGPTPATIASLMIGSGFGAWTVASYNPYIGITPTQLREIRQKVTGENTATSLIQKIGKGFAKQLPDLPSSYSNALDTIAPYASFSKAALLQMKHAGSIGMWIAFDVNLVKMCFDMAFIENPPLFYSLSVITFATVTITNPLLNQCYFTKRRADRIGPNSSQVAKRKILKRASTAWKRETFFYTAIIKLLEDGARTWLGSSFSAAIIFDIIAIFHGEDINSRGSIQNASNWTLLVLAAITIIISFSTTSAHILSFSEEIKKINEAQAKLDSEEKEKRTPEKKLCETNEAGGKGFIRRTANYLYNSALDILRSLPIVDLFFSAEESPCRLELNLERDEEEYVSPGEEKVIVIEKNAEEAEEMKKVEIPYESFTSDEDDEYSDEPEQSNVSSDQKQNKEPDLSSEEFEEEITVSSYVETSTGSTDTSYTEEEIPVSDEPSDESLPGSGNSRRSPLLESFSSESSIERSSSSSLRKSAESLVDFVGGLFGGKKKVEQPPKLLSNIPKVGSYLPPGINNDGITREIQIELEKVDLGCDADTEESPPSNSQPMVLTFKKK